MCTIVRFAKFDNVIWKLVLFFRNIVKTIYSQITFIFRYDIDKTSLIKTSTKALVENILGLSQNIMHTKMNPQLFPLN